MAKLNVSENVEDLCIEFTSFVENLEKSAVANNGMFTVGLSGGSSATIVAKALSDKSLTWEKWHVFFCDERFVPLTASDSNYNSLKSIFFDKVGIPKQQIYTLDGEKCLQEAAVDYSHKLKSVFGQTGLPRFDLLVLGMGPDGHICSLFPNHPLLDESEEWIVSIADSPKPPPQRITLTLPIINNAKSVCFTVTGASKAEMVQRVIKNPLNKEIPASLVVADKGTVTWFLDKGSGSLVN